MKGIMKGLAGVLAVIAFLAIGTADTQAGTGIYVGKDVSKDGTTILGVSVEAELGISVVPVVLEKGLMRKGDEISCQNAGS